MRVREEAGGSATRAARPLGMRYQTFNNLLNTGRKKSAGEEDACEEAQAEYHQKAGMNPAQKSPRKRNASGKNYALMVYFKRTGEQQGIWDC